jgi:hypothetical protein
MSRRIHLKLSPVLTCEKGNKVVKGVSVLLDKLLYCLNVQLKYIIFVHKNIYKMILTSLYILTLL